MKVQQLESGDELPVEEAAQNGADDLAGRPAIEIRRLIAERHRAVVATDGERRLGFPAARFLEEDFARRGEAVVADAVAGHAHGFHLAAGEQRIRLAEHRALDFLEIGPSEATAEVLATVADNLGNLPALLAARMNLV